MAKQSQGAQAFNDWRKREKETLAAVSAAVGDPGGQIAKWASFGRETLPLHLIAGLSHHTELRFEILASESQMDLACHLAELLARDAET